MRMLSWISIVTFTERMRAEFEYRIEFWIEIILYLYGASLLFIWSFVAVRSYIKMQLLKRSIFLMLSSVTFTNKHKQRLTTSNIRF